MSFESSYTMSNHPTFLGRIEVCIIKSAIAVLNEAPTVAKHAIRLNYARKVVENPPGYAERMAVGVVTNATIDTKSLVDSTGATVLDSEIEFQVNSMWDAYSQEQL